MVKVTRRAVVAAGVLAAFAAGIYYVARAESAPKNARKGPPPVPVITAKVEAADVPVVLAAIGTVQARASVAVKSRVDGHILETHFREGREHARGDDSPPCDFDHARSHVPPGAVMPVGMRSHDAPGRKLLQEPLRQKAG